MKKHIVAKTVLLLSFAAILVVGVFVSMQGVLVPQYAEAATCPVSSVTPAIGNQAAWDSKFSARYGTGGVPDLSSGAETPAQRAEKFSWQGHYWVRAYVSMAKTYGDTKYLDKAVSSIDNWFAYQETSQGWGASINPSQMFLDTGVIAQAITVFSYEVWNDSRFTAYRPKADSYIAKLEPILHTYDAQWANNVTAYNGSPSFYVYSTCGADGKSVCSAASLVMYNQGATMVKALLLIDRIKRLKGQTPDAGYLDKANKGAAYFKTFARLNGTAYVWDYGGARGSGIEDTSHGHLDLSHLVWAYQFGLGGLTSTDMARLAGTARVILSSAGANDVSTRVDGTGLAGTNDYERVSIGYDWIDLVDYDQTLLDKVINVFNAHMSAPSSARFFFGWAEILRKKNCVSLYDSVVGTPAPTPTPTPTLPPVLSVSPTSLSFGNVVVGTQSTAKTLTITNTGTGPLSFTSTFTFTGDFTGLGTCSTATPLAVGGSCVLNMTFTPTAIGTRTGTVTMTTNDANSPKIIAFSGTGVTSPTPTPVSVQTAVVTTTNVYGTYLWFQAESYSAMQGIVKQSTNIAALDEGDWTKYTAVDFGTQGARLFVAQLAVPAVEAGGTIDVVLDQPTGTPVSRLKTVSTGAWGTYLYEAVTTSLITGVHDVYLVFHGANVALLDAFGWNRTVPLNFGTSLPVLSVTPASLSFGNVVVGTQSTAKTLTITNTGTGPLSFTSTFTFTGDFTGLGTCSTATPLAVGGSCVLNMTFTPTAIGTRTGTVTMTTNDANSPKIIAFSGTGVTSPTPTPVFDVTPSFSTSAATLSIDLTPPYQNQLNWSYTDVPNPSTSFVRFTNITKNVIYTFATPIGDQTTNPSLRAGFSGGVRTGESWKGEIISNGTTIASTNITIGTTPGGTTLSAYTQIQGESYSAMQGIQNNGTTISDLDTTDWVLYKNVDFGTTGAKGFTAHMSVTTQFKGGIIEVYLDSTTGTPISRLMTVDTTSWTNFTDQSAITTPSPTPTGIHDVYLVFVGTEVAALDSFKFSTTTPTNLNPVPPSAHITVNGGKKSITVSAGDVVTKTWSSTGGATYDATWSAVGTCADAGKTNQHWTGFDGKNPAGDTESFPAQASQSGCTVTITYKVTNAAGTTVSDAITIIHSGGGVTPGGDCAAQGLTNHDVPLDWAGGHLKNFDMGHNNSVSIPITIPSEGASGAFSFVYSGTYEVITISKNKCDFTQTNCFAYTTNDQLHYTTLPFGTAANRLYKCVLQPSESYFVNIRNVRFNESLNTNNPIPDFPLQDDCHNSGLVVTDFSSMGLNYPDPSGCHFSLTY